MKKSNARATVNVFSIFGRMLAVLGIFLLAFFAGGDKAHAKQWVTEAQFTSTDFVVPYKGYTYPAGGYTFVNPDKNNPFKFNSGFWAEAGTTTKVTSFTVGKKYQYRMLISISGDDFDDYDITNPSGLVVKVGRYPWTTDDSTIRRGTSYVEVYIVSPEYTITNPLRELSIKTTCPLDPIVGEAYIHPGFQYYNADQQIKEGIYCGRSEWYKKKGDGTYERITGLPPYEKGTYKIRMIISAYTGRSGSSTASVSLSDKTMIRIDGQVPDSEYSEWHQVSYAIAPDHYAATYFDYTFEREFVVGNDQVGTQFTHTDHDDHGDFHPLAFEVISTDPAEVRVYDYHDDYIPKDAFEIPETVVHNGITYKVTEIWDAAFSGRDGSARFTTVSIPSTVRLIGEYAFDGCPNLERVDIATEGEGLTIKQGAFQGCTKLLSVYVPDRVLQPIGNKAFGYKDSDTKVTGFVLSGSKGSAAESYASGQISFQEKKLAVVKLELDGAAIAPVAGGKPQLLGEKLKGDARYQVATETWYEQVAEGEEMKSATVFELGKGYGYVLVLVPADGYIFGNESSITMKNVEWDFVQSMFIDSDTSARSGFPVGSLAFMATKVLFPPYDMGTYTLDLTEGAAVVTDEAVMSAIENTNVALINEGKVKYIATGDELVHKYDMDKDAAGTADLMISVAMDGTMFKRANVLLLGGGSVTDDCTFELDKETQFNLKMEGKYFFSKMIIVLKKRDISKAVIAKIDDMTCSGSALTPAITVTWTDGTVLEKDKDFSVSYSDNTNAGTAKITITGKGMYEGSAQTTFVIKEVAAKPADPAGGQEKEAAKDPAKGETVKDDAGNASYKITAQQGAKGGATVTYVSNTSVKVTEITINPTVTISGKSYKVTEIAPNAFKNNKKLKKIVIGKNIKKIGKNAFFGCRNLKTIIFKSTKLTKKTVGANAFKKIHKKAVAEVPKKKLSLYKKVLKAKGMNGKNQKVKTEVKKSKKKKAK